MHPRLHLEEERRREKRKYSRSEIWILLFFFYFFNATIKEVHAVRQVFSALFPKLFKRERAERTPCYRGTL